MTPVSASNKLIFPAAGVDNFKAAVNANSQVTITVYVYYDGTYNGNMPRLVVLGGILNGIGSYGVPVTATAPSSMANTWQQLSVQVTPTEVGVLEFYIDCDGTAGNVYVDDINITQ